jgi:ribose transport system ATP-binding protein
MAKHAGDLAQEEINHDAMVKLMVGRDLSAFYQHTPREPEGTVLKVTDLRTPVHPEHPLSFEVRAGEIVGLAGLVGAGRTELLQTLFGITPSIGGTIDMDGETVNPQNPIEAIHAGIALAPENRKQQGLVMEMALRENMSLPSLIRDQHHGFLNRQQEAKITEQMIKQMQIKTPSAEQEVRYLSGGNQQKVVLGKWLAMEPKLLLLDEPTRGIDVGAKQEIYGLMEKLTRRGVAILFVSSEMEEVLGMSDRALVMHEGRLSGELSRTELSEEAIMQLATGGKPAESAHAE